MAIPSAVRTAVLLRAAAAGASAPFLAQCSAQRKDDESDDDNDYDYAYGVHANIRYAAKAQTQAMAHWRNTTNSAHLPPSSRLIDAMAATQGV